MDKTKKTDASAAFMKQHREYKKINKELLKKNKQLEKQNKEHVKDIKDLRNKLQKLEKQKDNNNELSEQAKFVLKSSEGPIIPDQLKKLLERDVFGKRIVDTDIRKHSNDMDKVNEQLSWVHDNVESYMTYRDEQQKKDDRLIKTIKKLKKTIEEEQENPKYIGVSPMNMDGKNHLDSNKQSNQVIGNGTRKRKSKHDDNSQENCSSQESCSSQQTHSSQDSVVRQITRSYKNIKLHSPEPRSIPDAELEESNAFNNQHSINQRELRN